MPALKTPAKKVKKTAKTNAKRAAAAKTAPGNPAEAGDHEITIDRRRNGERRKDAPAVAGERRVLERRVKVNRRRQIDPTTCERDYSEDEVEFMRAMDEYKRRSGRMFPTCSEVLEVIRALGYAKAASIETSTAAAIEADNELLAVANDGPTTDGALIDAD